MQVFINYGSLISVESPLLTKITSIGDDIIFPIGNHYFVPINDIEILNSSFIPFNKGSETGEENYIPLIICINNVINHRHTDENFIVRPKYYIEDIIELCYIYVVQHCKLSNKEKEELLKLLNCYSTTGQFLCICEE